MTTTTTLTLDTPEAKAALARCTRLLLKWGSEDAETADKTEAQDNGDTAPSEEQNILGVYHHE